MPAARTIRSLLLFMLLFLQKNYFSFSQTTSYPYDEWIEKLSDKKARFNSGVYEITPVLLKEDSAKVVSIFNELEKRGASSGKYFAPRLNLARAVWLGNLKSSDAHKAVKEYLKKALNAAYETDDDSLVSNICWFFASTMYYSEDFESATMYSLYAAEIDEKNSFKTTTSNCAFLGDLLYKTRDYEKAIYYTKKSIEGEADTSASKSKIMSRWNTIGLCWQRMGNYDSAFFYFDLAQRMAGNLKDEIWKSIINGNKGQIYFAQKNYAAAKLLLESDYKFSKAYGERASAANSLQWVARINLVEGKKDSSLMQLKEALQLSQRDLNPNYLQNIYYATADVYRALGNNDSAYKYAQLYDSLHNVIESNVYNSRLEISRIRLDNLQNELTIKNLTKAKEAEELKRNLIIAIIVMLAAIGLLVLSRQKQRIKHKQQLALHEKNLAEAEIRAAREQLQLFTQSIIEKTTLIDNLQQQLQNKTLNHEQQQMIEELSQQTIITEEGWNKFKLLYEKIYPGFFAKLKAKAQDITVAEQRMAALTRLQLTNSQMASMLGISADSVRKTRLRLRQRLNLPADANLEELITKI